MRELIDDYIFELFQADEAVVYWSVNTMWDVNGMNWGKLAYVAKQRGKPIIYYAVRDVNSNFNLVKFHMLPNGTTRSEEGGVWACRSMHVEFGTITRRFLNYWKAYAYQLRLRKAHERVSP